MPGATGTRVRELCTTRAKPEEECGEDDKSMGKRHFLISITRIADFATGSEIVADLRAIDRTPICLVSGAKPRLRRELLGNVGPGGAKRE